MNERIRQVLRQSRIGAGVLGFGGSGLGNLGQPMNDVQAERTVARAWENGIRYFDTAPHYGLGLSEHRLGLALRSRSRAEFVLSTKVGRLLEPNPAPVARDTEGFAVPGTLRRRWDFSVTGVRRSLEQSLFRLGLDTIDIAFVHDPDQAWDGAARTGLEALTGLKAEGIVDAVGVGTNTTAGLADLIRDGLVDVVMIANRYSLLDQSALGTVLDPALDAGVPVVAAGVFASGLLSTARAAPGATFDYRAPDPEVLARVGRIASICADHGVLLPAAALAFPRLHPAVAVVAAGMRSPREVEEDVLHFRAAIPDALWHDLAAQGFIPAAALPRPPVRTSRTGDAATS